MAKVMFEPAKSKSYDRAKKAENKREEVQHASAAKQIAKVEVKGHEKRMHKMAKGGMIARGGGAVTKPDALKFTRNG